MIVFEEAKALARRYLLAIEPEVEMKLALLDEQTLERQFGWVFFYDSRAFLETGNFSDCLAGNGPVIVERSNGHLHPMGTAYPPQHYIDGFEKSWCGARGSDT
jgi:hypothetical protein